MIVSKIVGGLGNQLFCYAAGKSLAERLNVPFKIDIRAYDDYKLHAYALENFAISAAIANANECAYTSPASTLKKIWQHLSGKRPDLKLYQEQGLQFNKQLLTLPANSYLSGYWQCEKYFSSAAEVIRQEFSFKDEPDAMNADMLTQIRNSKSISVHIRRGDYISNPSANAVHGICELDYYQQAATYLANKLNTELSFYVFSDDPEWVKQHLHLSGNTIYVAHNNAVQNHEDLRLMSACEHHIIANSTFSWWGAWLNPSSQKIVIAPKQWFKDPNYDASDLVPASWIRL